MDIAIPPFREHVDVPLHGIGDHDLRHRIVAGEAAVRTVCFSQRNDKGGDVIEIPLHDLSRGERDRYSRRRRLRPCSAGRLATKADAGATRHDQVLNGFRFVLAADPGEVPGNRVALRTASSSVEIGFTLLGVSHQNIEVAWHATIGKRLAVQPGGDGGDVCHAQSELWHAARGNAVLDDRRNELSVLISENDLGTNQVRSGLSAPRVRAMAEAAIPSEELLAKGNLFGRRWRTHGIVWRTIAAGGSLCRLRRARWNLRRRLRSTHRGGKCNNRSGDERESSPCMHQSNPHWIVDFIHPRSTLEKRDLLTTTRRTRR